MKLLRKMVAATTALSSMWLIIFAWSIDANDMVDLLASLNNNLKELSLIAKPIKSFGPVTPGSVPPQAGELERSEEFRKTLQARIPQIEEDEDESEEEPE